MRVIPLKLFTCLWAIALMATACTSEDSHNPSLEPKENEEFASDASATVDSPMQPFFLGLMKSTDGLGERLKIPAIWMFSPEGNYVRSVSTDEELAALNTNYKLPNQHAQNITCQDIESAVAAASSKKWDLECGDGKWTALLLTNHEICSTCSQYESALTKLQKSDPDSLRAKYLVLTR